MALGPAGRRSDLSPVHGAQTKGGGRTVGQAKGLSDAEAYLITKESHGDPHAKNGQHFGVGQLNNNARKTYGDKVGCDPNTTNPDQQVQMFRAYVADRYGSAEKAMQHHKKNNWY
jgi:hypothetical protein